ncbi:MAG: hypothetical protein ACE5E6_01775 [Phycisphaerae bacterium]
MSSVTYPVARGRALTRGMLWSAAAALTTGATVVVLRSLRFSPSAVSNRIEDYGIAVPMLLVGLAGAACAVVAGRWLLLAVWPGRLGVVADADRLVLRLGPFGTTSYDAARLDVRYLFELESLPDDAGVEAYLSEDEQTATLLPRIVHPDARTPLQRVIAKFCVGTEADAAATLGPVIAQWRAAMAHHAPT